ERYRLAVLATILGGGMSSRLFQTLREQKALPDPLYASAQAYPDTGVRASRVVPRTGRRLDRARRQALARRGGPDRSREGAGPPGRRRPDRRRDQERQGAAPRIAAPRRGE